jgi:hypothetical protein
MTPWKLTLIVIQNRDKRYVGDQLIICVVTNRDAMSFPKLVDMEDVDDVV